MKGNIITIEEKHTKRCPDDFNSPKPLIGMIVHTCEPGSLGCGLKVWVIAGSPQMVQKPQKWGISPPSPRSLVLGSRKASSTAAHQF